MEAEKAGKFDKGQMWQSLSAMANRGELQKNWLTPTTTQIQRQDMQKRIDYRASIGRKYVPGSLEEQLQQHGPHAQGNNNTPGNRQGLSEQSQRNWQTFAPGTHNRGETPHRQVVKALVNGDKAKTQCLTVDQVFAEEIKGTNLPVSLQVKAENWPTPTMQDGKQGGITPSQMVEEAGHTGLLHIAAIKQEQWRTPSVAEAKNQNTSTQVYLQNQVGATPKQWATPRAGKTTDENPETWMKRQANGDVVTMPLTAQVKVHQWATPQASDHVEGRRTDLDSNQKCLGRDMKQWATPRSRDSADVEMNKTRLAAGKEEDPLCGQAKKWATPNAFDFKDGENREQWEKRAAFQAEKGVSLQLPLKSQSIQENEKEVGAMSPSAAKLNARWVEMLMNLPLGWACPSCPASVIQNWKKFMSGW